MTHNKLGGRGKESKKKRGSGVEGLNINSHHLHPRGFRRENGIQDGESMGRVVAAAREGR